MQTEEKVHCACGCGEEISVVDKWGRRRTYVIGHNRKKKVDRTPVRCACGCGEMLIPFDSEGRKRIFLPNHYRKYFGSDATNWSRQKRYRDRNQEKVRDSKKAYYRARKLKAMEIMGSKCNHCGLLYTGTNAPVFEFHHTDPAIKEDGVSRLLINKAWSKTLEELAKCVLLCANCHNQYHGGEW